MQAQSHHQKKCPIKFKLTVSCSIFNYITSSLLKIKKKEKGGLKFNKSKESKNNRKTMYNIFAQMILAFCITIVIFKKKRKKQ